MVNCNSTDNLSPVVLAISSLPQVIPSTLSGLNGTGSSVVDHLANAWFWGALIIILTVGVLLLLCVFYCCVCCCVSCGGRSENRKNHKCPKIFCALFTSTLIVTTIILLCVSVWLETEVDKGLTMFAPSDTVNTSNTSDFDTQSIVLFELFEFYRFRAALAVLTLVMLFLLLSLFAFCCAPACKSPAPVIVFMVLHVLLALLLSVYAGVTFAFVVFGTSLCVDVYNPRCLLTVSSSLTAFCSDVLEDGFTIVMLLCVTILILFLLQVFGSVYANLVRRSRYTKVETVGQSSEIFISTPLNVGGTRFHSGVWDAYGAQTVLGVKSRGQDIPSGYTPEAYPMGAVAPVAPIAPLPTDGSNEIKEVTLHLREVEAASDSSNDLHIVDV